MNTTVHEIASKMVDRFGVEMDIYQVSENSMEALNRMGMLRISKRAAWGTVKDQKLRVPLDCYEVKAVLRIPATLDAWLQTVKVELQDITFPPQTIFIPVPNTPDDPNVQEMAILQLTEQQLNYITQQFGPYEDYTFERPFIKVNCDKVQLAVIYNRIPIDPQTGLAEIPEHALFACLYHCLYTYFQPLFIMGKVQMGIWKEIELWRKKNFAQAETKYMMSRLSQNEMSKVHDIMSSFDRKHTRINS